tara:strand:- start:56 stop:904 length:849 start_codon:yes stop_codon:yes gene_type:complete
MRISVLVPTFNNLNYLKLFCKSFEDNSNYKHQIIFHINDGSDGSLDFIKNKKYLHTYSKNNIGLCSSMNKLSKLIKHDYVMYSHDDMYFCKNWDLIIEKEINMIESKLFYLSGTNISYKDGLIIYDCGKSPENFDIRKFDNFCVRNKSYDLQGSHWAPHIVHKDLWNSVNGFSTDFDPGDGSDPDFCMKLWNKNVRIFKCISEFKVYHFGSVTTRKRNLQINNGTKKFLLKYGFNPRFFRKYYLRGDGRKPYLGPVLEPKISINLIIDKIINKFKYYYFKIF